MLKCFFICFRVINSDLFAINNAGTYKWHIMVIALLVYFSAGGTTIAEPSEIEGNLLFICKMPTENIDGRLQSREFGTKKSVNVIRPIRGDRIQTFKDGRNRRIEFIGSNNSPGFVPASPRKSACNKQKENGNYCCANHSWIIANYIIDHFWIFTLILSLIIIVLPFEYYFLKHNVKYELPADGLRTTRVFPVSSILFVRFFLFFVFY